MHTCYIQTDAIYTIQYYQQRHSTIILCGAEWLKMMILNAGIVIFREYFSSDLPRSRWNYMCNRFWGDKDVKDKEEKGGVGEGPLGYEYLMMVRGD